MVAHDTVSLQLTNATHHANWVRPTVDKVACKDKAVAAAPAAVLKISKKLIQFFEASVDITNDYNSF